MSLVLSGCKTLDKAPIDEFRVTHFTASIVVEGVTYYTGACSIRQVTNKRTLASRRIKTADLSECNGNWGMTAERFTKLRVYAEGN